MYFGPSIFIAIGLCSIANGILELRPAGWLDKLVQYHREKLLDDVRKEAPINIKASLQPRPEGFVDSPDWNLTSVLHLMSLIRHSDGASEVRQALRRMMAPTRRIMSRAESWKHFPSLTKDVPNYFYYPSFSEEMYFEEPHSDKLDENSVLLISNPVESRLPSAQISVKLLKQILEARAQAARVVPSTISRSTNSWKTRTTVTKTTVPEHITKTAENVTVANNETKAAVEKNETDTDTNTTASATTENQEEQRRLKAETVIKTSASTITTPTTATPKATTTTELKTTTKPTTTKTTTITTKPTTTTTTTTEPTTVDLLTAKKKKNKPEHLNEKL